MSDLVPAEDIERIVGVRRHDEQHWARAVSAEQTVYILHSRECLDSGIDPRNCRRPCVWTVMPVARLLVLCRRGVRLHLSRRGRRQIRRRAPGGDGR